VEPKLAEGLEDPESAITFVDEGCARAAMVGVAVDGVAGVVQKQRPYWWSFPVAGCAPRLDQIMVCLGGAEWLLVNLFTRTASPHLLLLRRATGVHQPLMG
jgi:hypothetical protein